MRNALLAWVVAVAAVVWVPAASAWTWPVEGPVLRPFTLGDNAYAGGQHRGIDIGAVAGTPVRAAAGGQVTFAGTVPRYGKTLTIRTADGYAVTLLHLGSLSTSRGATVAEGQTVAGAGTAGDAQHADPYVYLGIRRWADEHGYVDPLSLLPPVSSAPEAPQASAAAVAQAPPPVVAQPAPAATPPAPTPLQSADPVQPDPAPEAGGSAEPHPAVDAPADVTVAAAHTLRSVDQASVRGIVDGRREVPDVPRNRRGQIAAPAMRVGASDAAGGALERSPPARILRTKPSQSVVEEPSFAGRVVAVGAAAPVARHPSIGGSPHARTRPETSAESGSHGRTHRELWLLGVLAAALAAGVTRRQMWSPATQQRSSQRHAPCLLGRRVPSVAVCSATHAATRSSRRCGRPVRVAARSRRPRRQRVRVAAGPMP